VRKVDCRSWLNSLRFRLSLEDIPLDGIATAIEPRIDLGIARVVVRAAAAADVAPCTKDCRHGTGDGIALADDVGNVDEREVMC